MCLHGQLVQIRCKIKTIYNIQLFSVLFKQSQACLEFKVSLNFQC